jgi:hypothetical protein
VYFPLLVDYLVNKSRIEHKRITGTKAGRDKDRQAIKDQVEAYAAARESNKRRLSAMGSYAEGTGQGSVAEKSTIGPHMSINEVSDNTPKINILESGMNLG